MKIRRGDIILVAYPFTDLSSSKKRPAIIISRDLDNRRLDNVILLPITTKLFHRGEETEVLIIKDSDEGKGTGLKIDSVVKTEGITSLSKSFISKKMGKVKNELLVKIEKALAVAIGIKYSK